MPYYVDQKFALFELHRPLYEISHDPEWEEDILAWIRRVRTRAIMRGSVQRDLVTGWIETVDDEVLREEALWALARRGVLARYGLNPQKGGLLVPAKSDAAAVRASYPCTGSLQYCLETAVCLHEGYEVYPELDVIHIAKGHTGALKRTAHGKVVAHTLNPENLLEAASGSDKNLMARPSTIAHFFAKRKAYDPEDIRHLLVRWWRKGLVEQNELESAAARFGMSKIMQPYIQMLGFIPRQTPTQRQN